jgi:TolA-binding protein
MKLARYIVVEPPSEAKLAREWEIIDLRSQPPRPAQRWLARGLVLAPVAIAAAVLLVFALRRPAPAVLPGAVFGSDTGTAQVDLSDGSHIEVDPQAKVAVLRGDPSDVHVEVQRGAALFEVSHIARRSFVVSARGVQIRVVGTRFRVNLDGSDRVRVSVERGVVEVRRSGHDETVQRLGAGEESTVMGEGAREGALSAAVPQEPAAVPAPTEGVAGPSTEAAPSDRSPSEVRSPANDTPSSAYPTTMDARQLFDAASAARRAGKVGQAAALFDALRRRFPADARAGLSAFELGRLRMDSMGDPAGASEALSQAIALSPAGSFREDAQARLVYAADAMHDDARCRAMRQAYLARYPRGVHAVNVASKCGGP